MRLKTIVDPETLIGCEIVSVEIEAAGCEFDGRVTLVTDPGKVRYVIDLGDGIIVEG